MIIKIAFLCVVFFVMDRFLLWIEAKGWLFYRKRKSPGGFLGNALLELNTIFQPSSSNVIEVKQKAGKIKPQESGSSNV